MAETPYTKFRLSADTLADLDSLAASCGGNRSRSLREAVGYWRAAVEREGRRNADELTREEWTLLAHTGTPEGLDTADTDIGEGPCRDWAHLLAIGLATMYDGRTLMLPSHKEDQRAAKRLAKKIGGWGITRGYALMVALRYFWSHQDAGIESCTAPEIWLTPTARDAE